MSKKKKSKKRKLIFKTPSLENSLKENFLIVNENVQNYTFKHISNMYRLEFLLADEIFLKFKPNIFTCIKYKVKHLLTDKQKNILRNFSFYDIRVKSQDNIIYIFSKNGNHIIDKNFKAQKETKLKKKNRFKIK